MPTPVAQFVVKIPKGRKIGPRRHGLVFDRGLARTSDPRIAHAAILEGMIVTNTLTGITVDMAQDQPSKRRRSRVNQGEKQY